MPLNIPEVVFGLELTSSLKTRIRASRQQFLCAQAFTWDQGVVLLESPYQLIFYVPEFGLQVFSHLVASAPGNFIWHTHHKTEPEDLKGTYIRLQPVGAVLHG